MIDFSKFEGRFDAALAILDGGGAASAEHEADMAKLREKLRAQQVATNEAKAAVQTSQKALEAANSQSEEAASTAARQIEALGAAKDDAVLQLEKAQKYSRQLKDLNAELRSANADNLGDASLINRSLESENEQLRAARDSDLSEVNAILARLTPLVEGN